MFYQRVHKEQRDAAAMRDSVCEITSCLLSSTTIEHHCIFTLCSLVWLFDSWVWLYSWNLSIKYFPQYSLLTIPQSNVVFYKCCTKKHNDPSFLCSLYSKIFIFYHIESSLWSTTCCKPLRSIQQPFIVGCNDLYSIKKLFVFFNNCNQIKCLFIYEQ